MRATGKSSGLIFVEFAVLVALFCLIALAVIASSGTIPGRILHQIESSV